MNPTLLFLIGLAGSLAISLAVILYLRSPLEKLLEELCGTTDRARFWTAFSIVTIGAIPLIFAMSYSPDTQSGSLAVLELARQLKWALVGLVSSVVVLGFVLSRFIPAVPLPARPIQTAPKP